ncbi:hypothetical protein HaLaN_31625 [Haematococcus lacustris]|uniref:Uncharacterized protein n=1 Tax=Haematococcus lacustris TaxID=44745 RepID=A0A6A0AI71_HAELA|nr:hypothetical protein HaLaN_31625 [Haematococcus lacustris]
MLALCPSTHWVCSSGYLGLQGAPAAPFGCSIASVTGIVAAAEQLDYRRACRGQADWESSGGAGSGVVGAQRLGGCPRGAAGVRRRRGSPGWRAVRAAAAAGVLPAAGHSVESSKRARLARARGQGVRVAAGSGGAACKVRAGDAVFHSSLTLRHSATSFRLAAHGTPESGMRNPGVKQQLSSGPLLVTAGA